MRKILSDAIDWMLVGGLFVAQYWLAVEAPGLING